MTFVLLYTVMLAMRGFSVSAAVADRSGEFFFWGWGGADYNVSIFCAVVYRRAVIITNTRRNKRSVCCELATVIDQFIACFCPQRDT